MVRYIIKKSNLKKGKKNTVDIYYLQNYKPKQIQKLRIKKNQKKYIQINITNTIKKKEI